MMDGFPAVAAAPDMQHGDYEAPDIAYSLWKVLHAASNTPDPVVEFAVELRANLQGAEAGADRGAGALREHLERKLAELQEGERELLQQMEAKQLVREKQLMELRKIEASLQRMEERKQTLRRNQRYTQLCLRDVSSRQAQLHLGLINAAVAPPQQLQDAGALSGPGGQRQDPVTPPRAERQEELHIEAVLWHLANRQLPPATVRQCLQDFEQFCVACADAPWTNYPSWLRCATAMLERLQMGSTLPHLQVLLLRCLFEISKRWQAQLQAAPPSVPPPEPSVVSALAQPRALDTYVRLLQSVNDDVKCEAASLVSIVTADISLKEAFASAGGVHALVAVLNRSSSEHVLEKALTCLWHLAMSDPNKGLIREAGGLVAVVELLHVENDIILENATIALGYLTRDDTNKAAIRECLGLEKLIATLYYPSESIQSKAAGALWNCASSAENKTAIRQLGAIPALIDLLSSRSESVQENAAGGLWNCAVDTENKRLVRELGGLGPLIALLSSPGESVVENASGTLWNCAAVGDNRVAIRKLGGLDPLLRLLTHSNENIQENAAGAIRNCAINDQNKVALRSLGGMALFVELLDKCRYSVLEKLTSTLWICSISNENKNVIRECGGFPRLLRALDHEQISIREKALGILRNCSTLAENRLSLIQCGVVRKLVQILEAPPEQLTNGMKEYAAATLWNVARDDKVSARVEGALPALTHLLADKTESVVENAAGALLSLTLNPENREHLRDCGGVHALCRLLQSKNEFILENVAGALKNCCNGSPANQRLVKDLNAIPHIIALLRLSGENVVRETALTLKNMASSDDCSEAIGRAGGVAELVRLAEQSDTDALRKVASFAIASLAKHPHNRAQVPPELLRHHSSHRDPRGGGEDGHHSARGR
eukprot:TRINITY_DN6977_c0_g2_i1.p1 TRINITY_DN6977_c0_g2~~TRINITY_DN6977_c0_g2_i1.p1  ORF type:complete len:893 (+),score=350.84 TRINITY_DN6977_c0_g2_i1:117-2795(+)